MRQLLRITLDGGCAARQLGSQRGIKNVQIIHVRRQTQRLLLRTAQHPAHLRVFHDVRQTLRRISRIKRHISCTGFPDCQQRQCKGQVALRQNADVHARRDTLRQQPMGQLVGALVKLGVAHTLLAHAHRQVVREALRCALDQLGDRAGIRILLRGQRWQWRGGQRQLPDILLGRLDYRLQQVQQTIGVSLHGIALKQRGGEQPIYPHLIHQLGHLDRNVGFGGQHWRGFFHRVATGNQVVEIHFGLIHQHDLKDRIDRRGAVGAQRLAECLETVKLVIEGGQILLTTGLQVLAERLTATQLGAQYQGVDEKTEHVFDIWPLAIGQRRADDDISLAAEPCNQQGEQCVQTNKG